MGPVGFNKRSGSDGVADGTGVTPVVWPADLCSGGLSVSVGRSGSGEGGMESGDFDTADWLRLHYENSPDRKIKSGLSQRDFLFPMSGRLAVLNMPR